MPDTQSKGQRPSRVHNRHLPRHLDVPAAAVMVRIVALVPNKPRSQSGANRCSPGAAYLAALQVADHPRRSGEPKCGNALSLCGSSHHSAHPICWTSRRTRLPSERGTWKLTFTCRIHSKNRAMYCSHSVCPIPHTLSDMSARITYTAVVLSVPHCVPQGSRLRVGAQPKSESHSGCHLWTAPASFAGRCRHSNILCASIA
jgi:hypothetical protein